MFFLVSLYVCTLYIVQLYGTYSYYKTKENEIILKEGRAPLTRGLDFQWHRLKL